MNCIECGKPIPEDAGPNAVRHPECCWQNKKGMWTCQICGHSWRPEVMHYANKYGYFFANCPKCTAKVEEPKKKFTISVKLLAALAMGSCLSIGPAMVFYPKRWFILSLFTILLVSVIALIVKGIRREI